MIHIFQKDWFNYKKQLTDWRNIKAWFHTQLLPVRRGEIGIVEIGELWIAEIWRVSANHKENGKNERESSRNNENLEREI